MAAQQPIEMALHLGFRFEPTPNQAVTYYLPRLIAGEPMHPVIRPYIHHADVYACEPAVLAARFRATPTKNDRFFLTAVERQNLKTGKDARYVRVAGPGSWSFQKGEDVRDAATNAKIGEHRKLRYKYKNGVATDWLMEEYSCACSVTDALVGNRERVFCRIYVSPNGAAAKSAARRKPAAASFEPQEEVEPCRKRIRVAPVTPPHPGPSSSTSGPGQVVQITPPMMQPGRSPAPAPPRPSTFGQVQIIAPLRMMQPGRSPAPAPPRPSTFGQVQIIAPLRMMQPGRSPAPAPPRPSTFGQVQIIAPLRMMQPGRSPAPAPPRPSTFGQVQIITSPMMQPGRSPAPAPPQPSLQPASSHQLQPRPSVPAPLVEQMPLTPRPGPAPAAPLPVDPAEAEDDFNEADDDLLRFASSLGDIIDIEDL